jgi:hypothetical protein
MTPIELTGNVDERHRLRADVPDEIPPGPVRLIVLLCDEDDAGDGWLQGVSREWVDELADVREDIYSLDDGQPVNAAG